MTSPLLHVETPWMGQSTSLRIAWMLRYKLHSTAEDMPPPKEEKISDLDLKAEIHKCNLLSQTYPQHVFINNGVDKVN